jgi:hypothetical protein
MSGADHQIVIEHMNEDLQVRCSCGGWAWCIPSFDRRLAYYGLLAFDKHCAKETASLSDDYVSLSVEREILISEGVPENELKIPLPPSEGPV